MKRLVVAVDVLWTEQAAANVKSTAADLILNHNDVALKT